jgi:hypothetical protein
MMPNKKIFDHPGVLLHIKGRGLKNIDVNLKTNSANKLIKARVKKAIIIKIQLVRAKNLNLLQNLHRSTESLSPIPILNFSNKTNKTIHKRGKLKRENLMQMLQMEKMEKQANLSVSR